EVDTGKNVLLRSSDGVTWVALPETPNQRFTFFENGLYLNVSGNEAIWTSADAVTWTQRHDGYFSEGRHGTDLSSGNGTYVVVGLNGLILTSADGQQWRRRCGSLATWQGVAFGNGLFVAVGWRPVTRKGALAVSGERGMWSLLDDSLAQRLFAVTSGFDR